jgi:DNA-binding PadR family transcriptional regulator
MPKEKFKKTIAKNILKNTATATAWIFSTFVQVGALTMQTFLSPDMYAELPDAYNWFSHNGKSKKKPKFKEITIRQSIRRLHKQGFIEKNNSNYILTSKGKELAKYIKSRKKNQQQKWDGKYRVVIFDIPENKRKIRNWLREELYLLDYRKLQESVFISKYALPEDLIKEIKQMKISSCVNYLLVDKVYKNII